MNCPCNFWLTTSVLLFLIFSSQAEKSAQPPSKFLSRHPESVYEYQKLPKGVYLPEDDRPGAQKFTFSGCKGIAYLTFDVDYTTGGRPDWFRRRLTTELLCKCTEILYQDTPENDPIIPGFTYIPLSLCIVSAQRKNKICDCEVPKKLLPVIGQYSPNPDVEDIDQVRNKLTISESGQKTAPSSDASNPSPTMALLIGVALLLA